MSRRKQTGEVLRCSFCHKPRAVVGKLVSSPEPVVYICGECIAICQAILEDDRATPPAQSETAPSFADHPILHSQLAAQFFTAVERWITRESQGLDVREEIVAMRSLAERMLLGQ